MLRIMMDGSGDMPDGWAEAYQLDVLPIPIQIGSKTYYQGVDISPDMFYELISDGELTPQTAAPSPDRIRAFIEKISAIGDTLIAITVSGKMSATYAMVQKAAKDFDDRIQVIPFDSGAGSAVLALMAREARLRERAGESLEEIMDALGRIRQAVMVVLTVDNLEYARRSGRVSALQAAVTSLLKIKPIITLKEGLLGMSEMVRTRRKALDQIVGKIQQQFGEQALKIAVVHAQDPLTATVLQERIESVLNVTELIITELSISVAANLGSQTVGIVALPEEI